MFKSLLFILLLVGIASFQTFAQVNDDLINKVTNSANTNGSASIPEIEKEIQNSKHTSETRLLLQLILVQAFIDEGKFEQAKKLAEETKLEANTLKLALQEGQAIYSLGNILFSQDKYLSALNYYQQAQHIFDQQGEQTLNAFALKAIGTVHTELGNLQTSLTHYDQALALMLLIDNTQGIAQVYNAAGATYYHLQNYAKAIEYYNYSLDSANSSSAVITAHANIAEAYIQLNDFEKAINHISTAIALSESSGSLQLKVYSLLVLAKLEVKRDNLQQAKNHFGTVLSLATAANFESFKIEALINIAKLNSNTEEALQFALLALKKAEIIGKKSFIRDANKIISTLYFSKNNFQQAYKYLKTYHAINADIIKSINTDSLTNLSNSLAASKANHEIEMLKKDALLDKAYIEEQKYSQALWIAGIIIICITIITSYRRSLLKKQTALLKNTVAERTKHIIKMGEIGKKITSLIELKKVVEVVNSQSEELFSADLFGLGIINKEKNVLTFPFTVEKGQLIPEYQLSMKNTEHPAIICTVKAEELNYSKKQELVEETPPLRNNKMKSAAYLPLVIEGTVLGCITVQKEVEGGFSEYDMSILRSITSYISVAVVNSMTLSDVKSVAYTDYLTQLPNRRSFIESFHTLAALNNKSTESLCIAITDIDKFKLFNDQYGHDGGDFVLKEVSTLMKDYLRKQDVVARWGGEEFVFILPNTDINSALTVLNHIREKLAAKVYSFNQQTFSITATFGIAEYEKDLEVDELINRADQALYNGKSNGRNKVVAYETLQ